MEETQKKYLVSYNPISYFIIFAVANILLVYFSWTLTVKLFILIGGFILPVFFLINTLASTTKSEKPSFLCDLFPRVLSIPTWIWLLTGGMALALRFWGFGTLKHWPGGDDALVAISSIRFWDHFQWKPFVTSSQVPSTLSYLYYFAAKISGSLLLGFQLPSILFSALTVVFGYFAARRFFTRSLAWTLGFLLAFNEWSLSLAWPLVLGVLILFWECVVFYFFSRLNNASNRVDQRCWAGISGLALGLGPYAGFSWVVLAALAIPFFWGWFRKHRDYVAAIAFFFFMALSLAPFLAAIWQEAYGGHIRDVAAWNGPFSWIRQVELIASYISVLFWGGVVGMGTPPGGGFLNVILASFFFIGAIELYRFRQYPLARFITAAFFLFLFPGLLSRDIETHRILLVLPLLLVVAAIGLQSLLLYFSPKRRMLLFAGFLMVSACIDINRLYDPWVSFSKHSPMVDVNENRICYRILKNLADREGPGWIISEMIPYTYDYSLAYCTYHFNAAWNSRLIKKDVKWAALFTENHYRPLLASRFPAAQWLELPPGKEGVPSRHVLGLISLDAQTRPFLEQWKSYYVFLQDINLQIVDLPTGKFNTDVLEKLRRRYPSVPDDPFIQSCFFEKLVFNYTSEKTFHPEDTIACWKNFSVYFRESFNKSYRNVVLCEKFGRLLASEGQIAEAKEILEKALKLSPGNPWLQYEIRRLDEK